MKSIFMLIEYSLKAYDVDVDIDVVNDDQSSMHFTILSVA